MVKERYCSYEVVMLLKEKGFDIGCYGRYSTRSKEFHFDATRKCENHGLFVIAAPTHQMACDWLMEKDIYISPKYSWFRSRKGAPHYEWKPVVLRLSTFNIIYPQLLDVCEYYKTYGEAVDAAIKYSLENLV